MDSNAAKQFLISRVVEQSEFERVPLSKVEKKMLYFTEVHPSIPNIYEVNEEFQRNYDSDEYEAKVANLLKNARDHDRNKSANGDQQWKEVLEALKKEDHYILVMADLAFRHSSRSGNDHRLRDFTIYVAVAIGLVLLLVVTSLWRAKP
jgi:hypothetical protein